MENRDLSAPPAAPSLAAGTADAYAGLAGLAQRFGSTLSPKDFYWAVNKAYHAVEAKDYDDLHHDHFEDLGQVWRRLTDALPAQPTQLRIADVGCGTGLVGHMLAKLVPSRVAELSLIDPSAEMLARAQQASAAWPFPVRLAQGVDPDAAGGDFDAVTMNSVMHHVVELPALCGRMAGWVRPGGAFLTAQDPRGDQPPDATLAARKAAFARRRWWDRAVGRARSVWRRLTGQRRADPLARQVSDLLLQAGAISVAMDARSIWAVTDFHVPGQPGGCGVGIPLEQLAHWLAGFSPITSFTYQFHGVKGRHLSPQERAQEQAWWDAGDPHGQLFGTAWRRQG